MSPTSVSLKAGASQQFTATVSGTGNPSTAVNWAVNGTVGGSAAAGLIDITGDYTAPNNLSSQTVFTIAAVSVVDPTKSGKASATVAAAPVVIPLSITPRSWTLGPGQTQQFVAYPPSGVPLTTAIWSINGSVGGNATVGTITNTGVYVAPTGITATTTFTLSVGVAGNPNETGSARLTVDPKDTISITKIAPAQGSVGDTVTVSYSSPNINGTPSAFFGGPGGSVSEGPTTPVKRDISVIVPAGIISGSVYLTAMMIDGSTAVSNSLPFTRLPNIVVDADRAAIASGETLQIVASELGSSATVATNWTADQGSISDSGLFTAPVVTGTTFVNIKGCFSGTTSCDSYLLEVDPFRITPDFPFVGTEKTLQLTAETGGNPVTADWNLIAGGGSIASDGMFVAPTDISGAGGVLIGASNAGSSQQATVAVTGDIPGMIARHGGYFDYSKIDPNCGCYILQRYAEAATAVGNRAFVAFSRGINETKTIGEVYVEVYDITDITAPKVIGAFEPPFNPENLSYYGNFLILESFGEIATYDISSGMPVFVAYANFQPEVGGVQTFITKRLVNGRVYGVPATVDPLNSDSVNFTIVDVTTGTPLATTYTVTLPGVRPGGDFIEAATGDGDHKIAIELVGETGPRSFIFDVSGASPVLVNTTHALFLGLSHDLLFGFESIYDVSGSTGVAIKDIAINAVSDIQGDRVLTHSIDGDLMEGRIDIFDLTDPKNPTDMVTLYGGPTLWNALYGNYLVTAQDAEGVGFHDVSAAGGLHLQATNDLSAENMVPFQQVVDGGFLYLGGEFATGGGAFEIRNVTGNSVSLGGYVQADVINAVQAAKGYSYVGDDKAFSVVDVSKPSSPISIGKVTVSTASLALLGSVVYDGTEDKHLVVVDVSNPSSPTLGTSLSLPDVALAMHINGNQLYVADQSGGLLVFDVSVPKNPVAIGSYKGFVPVNDLAMDGNIAILAVGKNGWVTLDITNPAAPVFVAQAPLDPLDSLYFPPGYATTVLIDNKIAYFGTLDQYCAVIGYDYSTPQHLRMVHKSDFSFFGSAGPITSLAAGSSKIFAGCPFNTVDAPPIIGWIAFDATQPRNVQSSVKWPAPISYYRASSPRRIPFGVTLPLSIPNPVRVERVSTIRLKEYEMTDGPLHPGMSPISPSKPAYTGDRR